jgi:uncharacterized protein
MGIRKLVSPAVLLAVGAVSANAASFDCAKASNKIERMICASARASQLDSDMADAYRAASAAASDRETLKIAQRHWLAQRDQCQDETCLISVYEQRITALSMSAPPADEPEKDDCGKKVSGPEIAACYSDKAAGAEAYMNVLIDQMKAQLIDPESQLAGQSAWREYRDKECQSQVTMTGSWGGAEYQECLFHETERRTEELRTHHFCERNGCPARK